MVDNNIYIVPEFGVEKLPRTLVPASYLIIFERSINSFIYNKGESIMCQCDRGTVQIVQVHKHSGLSGIILLHKVRVAFIATIILSPKGIRTFCCLYKISSIP